MTLRTLRLIWCSLAALSASVVHALPLRTGEHLTYKVSWAVVPGAGEIKIDAQTAANDPERLVVTSATATRGLAKILLPFQASAESIFDVRTGRLLGLHEKATTRAKPTDRSITFDYAKREASYVKRTPPEEPRTLPLPEGDPVDLIMALLQTRTWNLQPGEKRDALVIFDDDFYELTIHALRFEEVRTPVGTFNTLVLEPRMEKTEPKGMFKRGSTVKVWIAQDLHKLPVRFEVEFKIGTGTATLAAYRPPKAATAAANGADASR
jgi:hypothetical protein